MIRAEGSLDLKVEKIELGVEYSVHLKYVGTSDAEKARILAYALKRFELALKSEFERVVAEHE